MKQFLNEKYYYTTSDSIRNLIDTYNVNKCKLPVNLQPECYVSN